MNPGFKLCAPVQNRAPGRPRKTRIRSSSEGKGLGPRKYKCGRCGRLGHHANKCKNSVDAAFGEDEHWGAENAEEPAVKEPADPLEVVDGTDGEEVHPPADPVEVVDGTDGEEVHPPADQLQEPAREPTPSSTNASVVRYIYIFICLCLLSYTKYEM